jgi:hypothetical protein
MFADLLIQASRPGTSRNFIARAPAIIMVVMAAKIAMPPPRGTVLAENRSLTGRDTKPNCPASFFVRAVRNSDREKEPTRRAIANMVSV